MSIPKFENFLYPFLLQLKDKDLTKKEMMDALSIYFKLSEEDLKESTQSGGANRLSDRVDWARQWLRRALFMEISSSGKYHILERGLEYLKTHSDLRQIDLLKYPEFYEYAKGKTKAENSAKSQRKSDTDIVEELTPTEQLEVAYSSLNDDLATDILQKAREMSPYKFEQLVLDLLLSMGYGGTNKDMAMVTPISHDNGVDGIIPEDALGLDKIYIQAKRYTEGVVGKPEIQQFVGALNEQKASKGVFVTTSTFTQGAKESASKATSKIVLIDGMALAKYMIEFNVGVSTKKTYIVKRIDTDYFEE